MKNINDPIIINGIFYSAGHTCFVGTPGRPSKSMTFNKEDFRPELAPANATIEEFTLDGINYVLMKYTLGASSIKQQEQHPELQSQE